MHEVAGCQRYDNFGVDTYAVGLSNIAEWSALIPSHPYNHFTPRVFVIQINYPQSTWSAPYGEETERLRSGPECLPWPGWTG